MYNDWVLWKLFKGLSMFWSRIILERVMVMLLFVRGCFMLNVFFIRRVLGVGFGNVGMVLFGMDWMFFFFIVVRNEDCICFGSWKVL